MPISFPAQRNFWQAALSLRRLTWAAFEPAEAVIRLSQLVGERPVMNTEQGSAESRQ